MFLRSESERERGEGTCRYPFELRAAIATFCYCELELMRNALTGRTSSNCYALRDYPVSHDNFINRYCGNRLEGRYFIVVLIPSSSADPF